MTARWTPPRTGFTTSPGGVFGGFGGVRRTGTEPCVRGAGRTGTGGDGSGAGRRTCGRGVSTTTGTAAGIVQSEWCAVRTTTVGATARIPTAPAKATRA